jgi:alpha-methylacyl-CoA racemase
MPTSPEESGSGPLVGVRVVELAAIGPVPFAAMLLSDLGADVIRVDRPGAGTGSLPVSLTGRGRRSVVFDLKQHDGRDAALRLIATADVLVEGLRPGVTERLGVGPADCLARNRRLVYGRMTGWGQEGPLADRAGHDIDYIALSGALHSVGRPGQRPVPPLNLVGDYGGGALYLVVGVLSALIERAGSGRGQVVDAAMIDGAASLMTLFYEMRARGLLTGERGENLLDGGAPFYDTYETRDGGYVAVGALEPEFYSQLLATLEIDAAPLAPQYDRSGWPQLRRTLAARFAAQTRDEWAAVFAGRDACVAPVLSLDEAPHHPHNVHRSTFVVVGDEVQPAPAPRFSRSPSAPPHPGSMPGEDTDAVLVELGYRDEEIAALRAAGAVG